MKRPIILNKSKAIDPVKVEKHFQAAFGAHQAGKLDEAKGEYLKVLALLPADMETLYLIGTACSQSGQFEEARAT